MRSVKSWKIKKVVSLQRQKDIKECVNVQMR